GAAGGELADRAGAPGGMSVHPAPRGLSPPPGPRIAAATPRPPRADADQARKGTGSFEAYGAEKKHTGFGSSPVQVGVTTPDGSAVSKPRTMLSSCGALGSQIRSETFVPSRS